MTQLHAAASRPPKRPNPKHARARANPKSQARLYWTGSRWRVPNPRESSKSKIAKRDRPARQALQRSRASKPQISGPPLLDGLAVASSKPQAIHQNPNYKKRSSNAAGASMPQPAYALRLRRGRRFNGNFKMKPQTSDLVLGIMASVSSADNHACQCTRHRSLDRF
jgi:hypothetical protein